MAVKHGKSTSVLVDDNHLTGRLSEASTSYSRDVADKTPFGVDWKEYVAGLRDATVSLSGFFDGDTGQIHDKLSGLATSDSSVPLSWGMGSLSVGETVSLIDALEVSYEIPTGVAQVVGVSMEAQAADGVDLGVSLAPHSSRTSDGNESSVDNGSSTSNGAVAHLHVTAVSGTNQTLDVTIQDSSDNSTWADLASFTQATAKTSERITISGSVDRYIRAKWTLGGTSPDFTFAVVFSRR